MLVRRREAQWHLHGTVSDQCRGWRIAPTYGRVLSWAYVSERAKGIEPS